MAEKEGRGGGGGNEEGKISKRLGQGGSERKKKGCK